MVKAVYREPATKETPLNGFARFYLTGLLIWTCDKVSKDDIDRTNNATERIIGLDYKNRVKTMLRYKRRPKSMSQ
jgi:hypothetical protein